VSCGNYRGLQHGFVAGRVLLCLARGVQVGSVLLCHCRHNLHGFVAGRVLLCLARGVQVGSIVMRVITDTTYKSLWQGGCYCAWHVVCR